MPQNEAAGLSQWLRQFTSGAGAASGLLAPKCPLCWIALFGAGVSGARTQWLVELCSIAVYSVSVWFVLRLGRRIAVALAGTSAGAGVLAVGMWAVNSREMRMLVFLLLIASVLVLARLTKWCCAGGRDRLS